MTKDELIKHIEIHTRDIETYTNMLHSIQYGRIKQDPQPWINSLTLSIGDKIICDNKLKQILESINHSQMGSVERDYVIHLCREIIQIVR